MVAVPERGVEMRFETPQVTDFGSIATHTYTNTGQVPGRGPQGKDRRTEITTLDKFGERSDSAAHGLS